MKKFISVLLIITMVLSLTACGGNKTEETVENAEVVTNEETTEVEDTNTTVEDVTVEETENDEAATETEEPVANEIGKQESSNTDANTGSSAPQTKPEANTQAPANTTEQKPADKKEEVVVEDTKEEEKEEVKEEAKEEAKEEISSATLGQTLLAVFNKNSSMGTQELAEKLISNKAILFMGGAMPVEPGLLSGFDNAEITGFKEGATFGPMMGSIAFVGYVFELEDGADVETFKATLKSNANPRWQICVEAEETIVASAGNKVFFLMCPRSLEQ